MTPMPETSHVWRIVEEWRSAVRFPPNQSKIAEHVGVARSAVSDWKSGKARPSPEHLEALGSMMEAQLGPDVHDRLAAALLSDMGYRFEKIGDREYAFPKGVTREQRALIDERMIGVPPREIVREVRATSAGGFTVISMLFRGDERWTHRALDDDEVERFMAAGYDELRDHDIGDDELVTRADDAAHVEPPGDDRRD